MSATQTRYRPSPAVLARTVGDRVILTRADMDGFEVLEGAGAAVWQLLGGGVTLAAVADTLARSFEAPRDVIARDLEALVRELSGRGLVEAEEPSRG